MRVYGCVFCSVPLLFVYLHMRISSSNASSIAGVLFDSAGGLCTTLLLRTTCMRSCCTLSARCVAALQTKKPKNHAMSERFRASLQCLACFKTLPGPCRGLPDVCQLHSVCHVLEGSWKVHQRGLAASYRILCGLVT